LDDFAPTLKSAADATHQDCRQMDDPSRRFAELASIGTGPVSDAMELLRLPRAVITGWRFLTQDPLKAIVGPAYTVRQGPKSRAAAHEENRMRQREVAGGLAPAGCVVVIDVAGRTDVCTWGENLSLLAQSRGVAGMIAHGAVRDSEAIRRVGFPVLCRGLSPIASRWDLETVALNEPVTIDGVLIRPGDIVYGDADAVLAIPQESADAVFERAAAIQRDEEQKRRELAAGRR
jgi:regulator of RNase E activity RraA